MDFLSLSHRIQEIISSAIDQQIVFCKRIRTGQTSKYKAFNFEIDRFDIGDTLKNIVINEVENNSNYTLKPYSINIETMSSKNEIYELPANEILNLKNIFQALEIDKIETINTLTASEINPNFYMLMFRDNENIVIAFTRYSPATIFKGKWFFTQQSQVFKEGLSISNYVHCLYYSIKQFDGSRIQNIVVFKKHKYDFEQIFDYKDDYKAKANAAISLIKENNLLSNVDIFSSFALNDIFMMKKLAKIQLENKVNIVKEKFKNVNTVADEFENFNVQINSQDAQIIIPYNADKEYIENVLRILNTEFMSNIITEDKLILPDNNIAIQHNFNFAAVSTN